MAKSGETILVYNIGLPKTEKGTDLLGRPRPLNSIHKLIRFSTSSMDINIS